MVPPWTPPAPPPDSSAGGAPAPANDGDEVDGGDAANTQAPQAAPTSPPSPPSVPIVSPSPTLSSGTRFSGARRNLGEFARTRDNADLRRSLGHYVRSGYGGSGTSTQRHGGTAATAGRLSAALANVASGQPAYAGSPLDPALLAGRSADEIMDAVVEAVRPIDGSQDAEAERESIRDAMSDLLGKFPDADLLSLDAEQRDFAIEAFAANDVVHRFELDLGKTLVEKATSAAAALACVKQARDYIKQAVAASFRALRATGRSLTSGNVARVVHDALKATFQVFEGYDE